MNNEIERRILGTESLKLIDGSEKEVNIYAVRLSEKNQLSRKHRKKIVIGTGANKTVDIDIHDDEIIKGILDIAFQGQISYDDLDFDADWVYNKYFNPKNIVDKSKNSNTSESSEVKEGQ
jgi:hypothetical protein